MGLIQSRSQSQLAPSRQCCRAGTGIAPTSLTAGISLVSSSSGENGAKACRADKADMAERTGKDKQIERVEKIDVEQELKAFEAMVIKAEREVGIHIDQNNQDHDRQDVGGLEGSTLNKRSRLGTMIGYKRSLATAPHATATRSPPPISTSMSNYPCQTISPSAISLRLSTGPSSSIHPYSSGNRDDTKSARSGSDKSARRAEREWLAKIDKAEWEVIEGQENNEMAEQKEVKKQEVEMEMKMKMGRSMTMMSVSPPLSFFPLSQISPSSHIPQADFGKQEQKKSSAKARKSRTTRIQHSNYLRPSPFVSPSLRQVLLLSPNRPSL